MVRHITPTILCSLILIQTAPAQWTQIKGPYDGSVVSFAAKGTALYAAAYEGYFTGTAGGYGGGVFRSTNQGRTWEACDRGIGNGEVVSITSDGQVLYASTGWGAFRSTDDGNTWTDCSASLPNQLSWQIVADSANVFYVAHPMGGSNGVFRSTDRGLSWFLSVNGLTFPNFTRVALNGSHMYAGTWGLGIFRSTDNGNSWAQSNSKLTNLNITALLVESDTVFAGTDGGVFMSTNTGVSWMARSKGLTNPSIKELAYCGQTLYAGIVHGGVYISRDHGENWSAAINGLDNQDVYAIAGVGNDVLVGTYGGGGVFLSSDSGVSWRPTNEGLTAIKYTDIVGDSTTLYVSTLGTAGGVFRSTDSGSSWKRVTHGLSQTNLSHLAVSGNKLYAGTYGGGVALFSSTNKGDDWIVDTVGLTGHAVNAIYGATGFGPGAPVLVGTDSGLFVYSNNERTWLYRLSGSYPWCITARGAMLFAGGFDVLYRSTDAGTSWSPCKTKPFDEGFRSIAATSSAVYANSSSYGLYRSTNDGDTWSNITKGLRYPGVNSLAAYDSLLFAATPGGLFWSSNMGTEWKLVGAPFGNPDASLAKIIGLNVYATLATNNTFYRCSLSTVQTVLPVVAQPGAPIPYSYAVEQNYPNPFNPSTTIRYALPRRSHVLLTVFNTLGQQVAVLQNGEQAAGYHDVRFDGSGLASGVYFYRLQAGDFAQTRKLLILK